MNSYVFWVNFLTGKYLEGFRDVSLSICNNFIKDFIFFLGVQTLKGVK